MLKPLAHVIEPLQAEGRRLLCFLSKSVKWGQLRLKLTEIQVKDAEIYLILMSNNEDIERIFRVSRREWDSLAICDTFYKVLRLDQLRPVNPLTFSVHLNRSTELPVEEQEQATEMVVEVANITSIPSLPILWPHYPPQETSSSAIEFYTGVLCDSVLLSHPLGHQVTPRLIQKWLLWLERHFSQAGWCWIGATQHFLTLMSTARPMQPLQYGSLQWPMAREWLSMHCLLFLHQRITVEEFEKELKAHIQWIQCQSWKGFYHRWQDFYVNGQLWQQHQQQQVTISSLWLLHCTVSEYRHGPVGCIVVEYRILQQELLPQFYRLVLSDALHLWRCEGLSHAILPQQHLLWQRINEKKQKQQDWEPLHQYNLQEVQNLSSPVMRLMMRWEQQQEERRLSETETTRISDAVEDIEDLLLKTPPCMERVMKQKEWLKNWDRFRLVGWFYDAGYSKEMVVQYMCRNDDTQEHRQTIQSLYQSCVSAPDDKRHVQGRVSAGCGKIIDDVYEQGNVLRCPFEEAQNGEKRNRNHTSMEKSVFQTQCGSRGNMGCKVTHPLDYVQSQCFSQ